MIAKQDRRAPRAILSVLLACTLFSGCEHESGGSVYRIPGPTVPSPLPTLAPYLWDTREELDIWTNNAVSHGPISVEGTGREAVIRVETGSAEWVLRGPDLDPPASAVQTVRLRARWTRARPMNQPSSAGVNAHVWQPGSPVWPSWWSMSVPSSPDWVDIQFGGRNVTPQSAVGFVNLYHSADDNKGILEIDRIELVQNTQP
jgi:hypothetical protein